MVDLIFLVSGRFCNSLQSLRGVNFPLPKIGVLSNISVIISELHNARMRIVLFRLRYMSILVRDTRKMSTEQVPYSAFPASSTR